jgi:hypothetical protein
MLSETSQSSITCFLSYVKSRERGHESERGPLRKGKGRRKIGKERITECEHDESTLHAFMEIP